MTNSNEATAYGKDFDPYANVKPIKTTRTQMADLKWYTEHRDEIIAASKAGKLEVEDDVNSNAVTYDSKGEVVSKELSTGEFIEQLKEDPSVEIYTPEKQRWFRQSDISAMPPSVYAKHQDDILSAQKEGRIIRDGSAGSSTNTVQQRKDPNDTIVITEDTQSEETQA